jgi:hypothetical protein
MKHPLATIAPEKRWLIFVPLLVMTLAVMGILQATSAPLTTDAAPQGIISFEFAGDVPAAQQIVDSWDAQARGHAGFNLGFDFLFLVLYSTTIAFACAWIAGSFQGGLKSLAAAGLLLAWGQWLAALLDAVENTGLLIILLDAPAAPWPQIARWCALVKFALVILGLVYALLGAIWAASRAVRRR